MRSDKPLFELWGNSPLAAPSLSLLYIMKELHNEANCFSATKRIQILKPWYNDRCIT
jgi:hypothetical protein